MTEITYSSGPRTTADSAAEGRLRVGTSLSKKKKRKILKGVIKKYGNNEK